MREQITLLQALFSTANRYMKTSSIVRVLSKSAQKQCQSTPLKKPEPTKVDSEIFALHLFRYSLAEYPKMKK